MSILQLVDYSKFSWAVRGNDNNSVKGYMKQLMELGGTECPALKEKDDPTDRYVGYVFRKKDISEQKLNEFIGKVNSGEIEAVEYSPGNIKVFFEIESVKIGETVTVDPGEGLPKSKLEVVGFEREGFMPVVKAKTENGKIARLVLSRPQWQLENFPRAHNIYFE